MAEVNDPADETHFSERQKALVFGHSPLGPPLPDPTNRVADDPDAIRLGQYVFFDRRLSANGSLSCASCHVPDTGFADGKPVAEGIGTGMRNTPTLWNVSYHRWFALDGRFDSLWSQALDPIEGPEELGSSRLHVAHLVYKDRALKTAYERIFGTLPPLDDPGRFPLQGRPMPAALDHAHHVAWAAMTTADQIAVNTLFVNLGKALAAYQRRIVSRKAPFDTFVEGLRTGDERKLNVLSSAAQRGLKVFIGIGNCRLCHTGPNFTDGEFHNVLVPPRDGGRPRDPGRYTAIRHLKSTPFLAGGEYSDAPGGEAGQLAVFLADSPENWGRFKTPGLRNVALTAPYMHQGQFATLADVVRFYSTLEGAVRVDHHQEQILAPLNLSEQQQADLVAFLQSLTDTSIDPDLLHQPESPSQNKD